MCTTALSPSQRLVSTSPAPARGAVPSFMSGKSWAQRMTSSSSPATTSAAAAAAGPHTTQAAAHHPADDGAILHLNKSAAVAPTDSVNKGSKDKLPAAAKSNTKPVAASPPPHSPSSTPSQPLSAPPSSSPLSSSGSSSASSARNLLNYFLTNLRGHLVLVQLLDCSTYEGIFHTADIQPAPAGSVCSG